MQLCAHITVNEIEKLPDSIGDLANLQSLTANSTLDDNSAASSHHRQQDQNDP
jgi:hypothetical protein